eukprot:8883676-Heterocapsa_arctica.AAC.1
MRPTLRPRAWENRSTIGSASDFKAVAMEMYSASQVDDAVEPWRFERHARGQQRWPSLERTSSHRPEVLLAVSMSPA